VLAALAGAPAARFVGAAPFGRAPSGLVGVPAFASEFAEEELTMRDSKLVHRTFRVALQLALVGINAIGMLAAAAAQQPDARTVVAESEAIKPYMVWRCARR
jgi:hypothetical protein